MTDNKILVVVGPTAVGKTSLGIELAKRFNGEIISGDSQQVYKDLNIGTAKATPEEQKAAVHHLIDVRELNEKYSAHDFVVEATKAINDIFSRGKVPIIVGGTGLYIQALIEGYHLGGEENHKEMMKLRKDLSHLPDEMIYLLLQMRDIEIPEFNRRRAQRALEISLLGGGENKETPFQFCLIGLTTDREVLYERINHRVDEMVKSGLIEEAKRLYDDFPEVQATKAIGYKEFFPYFSHESTLEETIELVKRNSRRYAKRQLTWFNNRMNVEFFDVANNAYPENVFDKVKSFLE